MAGTNANFPLATVKKALRDAMVMGSPNVTADKATFIFSTQRTYPPGTQLDQEGRPLDPSVSGTSTTPDPVVLDEVAVEFKVASPEEIPVGVQTSTKLLLTLLDDEWALVQDAVEVRYGGDRYRMMYTVPMALFDLDVRQVHCFAVQEA